MRAEGWSRMPLVRTNLHLEPHEGTLEDLLADVDDGLFLETNKSWSIDDKRLFQFGTQIAWEIKKGKLGRMLRDGLHGSTPVFWGSMDAVGGQESWVLYGLTNCGKGSGTVGARLARCGTRSVPRRPGRRQVVKTLRLAERALQAAEGDEAEALVHAEHSGVAQFASSEVHQPTLIDNQGVRLRIVRDGKVGSAYTNRVDDEGLAELARRAGEVTDSARPDPLFPGLAPPADLPAVNGYDEETAALGADDQARLAAAAIEGAADFGLYGYFTSGVTELAVASTTGVRDHQVMTDAVCLCLAAVDGKSGWAVRTSSRVGDLTPSSLPRRPPPRPREPAARSSRARALPGRPGALCSRRSLTWFAYDSFSGLGFIEERSFLNGRLGEQAMDEKVSIRDDALDERGLPKRSISRACPSGRCRSSKTGC